MLSRARVLCNSAHVLLERTSLEALDVRFLQRSFACSGRPLTRCIATAFVARFLISESAQHELQHLAFIARVRNSLSLSLSSFSAGYLSFSAGSLRLSLRLSWRLSLRLSLHLSLCVSLRLELSRSASRLTAASATISLFASASARFGLGFIINIAYSILHTSIYIFRNKFNAWITHFDYIMLCN